MEKTMIQCVTKIWTNFNLNFLLFCASTRDYCWHPRKPDASSKQLYSQNGRDWNQVRNIIEELRSSKAFALSNKNNSILWILEIKIYNVVAKYTALKQSNEGSSMPTKKSHSKERTRIPVVERAQALISDDPGQSLRKLALIANVRKQQCVEGGIAEKNLRYKSYTLKIRQMLSEAAKTKSCRVAPLGSHSGLSIV